MKVTNEEMKEILEKALEKIKENYPRFNESLVSERGKLERLEIILRKLPHQIKNEVGLKLVADARERVENFIWIINRPDALIPEARGLEGMKEIFTQTTAPFLDRLVERIQQRIKELKFKRRER